MLMQAIFLVKNYAVKHKNSTFASVFHGIRFKVRRLFVATTSNFFFVPVRSASKLPETAMQCVMLRGSRGVYQIGRILSGGRDGSMETPENRIFSIELIVWLRLGRLRQDGRGSVAVGCGRDRSRPYCENLFNNYVGVVDLCEFMLMHAFFLAKNYAVKHKNSTFASVFHGIRFNVRRLFVAMTGNFFLYLPVVTAASRHPRRGAAPGSRARRPCRRNLSGENFVVYSKSVIFAETIAL